MRRTVNTKSVFILGFGLAALGGLALLTHSFQASRTAKLFLDEANAAIEQEDPSRAIRSFRSHLRLQPDSTQGRISFANYLMKIEHFGAAASEFEHVLRSGTESAEIRRKAAECSLNRSRYTDALDHLSRMGDLSNDGEAQRWKGRCLYSQREFAEAANAFSAAIELRPDDVESYALLATLLSEELDRLDDAEKVLARLTENNPNLATAFLIRGSRSFNDSRKLLSSHDQEAADQKMAAAFEFASRAVELDGENYDALLLLLQCEMARDNWSKALKLARRAQTVNPKVATPFLLQAEIAARLGTTDESIKALRSGLPLVEGDESRARLLSALSNVHLDRSDLDIASELTEQLANLNVDAPMVAYLRGRIAHAQSNFTEAIQQLESAQLSFVNRPEIQKRLHMLLGDCLQEQGRLGESIEVLRKAITFDPNWSSPRLALIQTFLAEGQRSAAYQELLSLVRESQVPAQEWGGIARIAYDHNARDSSVREWPFVINLLDRAIQLSPKDVDLAILKANALMFSGQADLVDDHLRHFKASSDDLDRQQSERLTLTRIVSAANNGEYDVAENLLREALKTNPNSPAYIAAEVNLKIQRNQESSSEALQQGVSRIAELSNQDQSELRRSLGLIALRVAELEFAKQMFGELRQSESDDSSTWLFGLRVALSLADVDQMQEVVDRLGDKEDVRGDFHFASAHLLNLQTVAENSKDDPANQEKLRQALSHLKECHEIRAEWASPFVLESEIHYRLNDFESALSSIRKAIDLGERSPEVIRNAVAMMVRQGKFEEADRMTKLVDRTRFSTADGLGRVASIVSAQQDDLKAAIDLARASAKDSDDYRDHLWLGQLSAQMALRSDGDQVANDDQAELIDEAKQAFRSACDLSQDSTEVWIQHVRFLAAANETELARSVTDQAYQNLPAPTRDFAVAICYDLTDDVDKAASFFRVALDNLAQYNSADREKTLRTAATFYLKRNRPQDAKRCLDLYMKLPLDEASIAWGRRSLAGIQLGMGGESAVNNALALVNSNLQESPLRAADLRAKAVILASSRKSNSVPEQLKLWESIANQSDVALSEDHLRFAQLLKQLGKWNDASEQMRTAIQKAKGRKNEPVYVSQYVSWLMEQDELSDAESWLSRLANLRGESQSVAWLEAELNTRKGNHSAAIEMLKSILNQFEPESMEERPLFLSNCARLIGRISNVAPESQRLEYRQLEADCQTRATELDGSYRFQLASALANQGKVEQAIEAIAKSEITAEEAEFAISTIDRLVLSGLLTDKQLIWADQQVDRIAGFFDNENRILGAQASIRRISGQIEAAIKLYRQILRSEPENLVAMNNLAVALCETDDRLKEAAELSDKTLQMAGRIPALLDTRAAIAVAAGNTEFALTLLDEITRKGDARVPIYVFHRAVAKMKTGNRSAAAADLQLAMENGLRTSALSSREQSWLVELKQL